MPLSSWICTNNSKTMLLRIVHPGGHVELHDRPVIAAEIMSRNPRSCVAYPYVFQQPWAIVAPDTVLMLGEKYYVVPISTIRKLQRLSPRRSPSPAREFNIGSSIEEIRHQQSSKDGDEDGVIPSCCIFRNITNQLYGCKKSSRNKIKKPKNGSDVRTSSSSTELCDSSALASRMTADLTGHEFKGSANKKAWSSENWQPSLESITEE